MVSRYLEGVTHRLTGEFQKCACGVGLRQSSSPEVRRTAIATYRRWTFCGADNSAGVLSAVDEPAATPRHCFSRWRIWRTARQTPPARLSPPVAEPGPVAEAP